MGIDQQSESNVFNIKEMSAKFGQLMECPREIWFIYGLKFLEATAYFSASFILVKFLSEEVGMSDVDAGWVYGAWGMMVSVFGMMLGFAVDNLGVRKSLIAGGLILFISRLTMMFGTTQTVILAVLLVVYPLGAAFAIPVQTLALRRYTDERTQKFAFSLFYVVMNVSAAAAAFLINGVRNLTEDGLELSGTHFTMYRVVLFMGVLCTGAALGLIFLVREIRTSRDGSHSVQQFTPQEGSAWTIMQETFAEGKFWRFVAVTVIFIGVRSNFTHMDATLPKYSTREFGEDFPYELLMSINPVAIIFLVPTFTYITDKLNLNFAQVLIIGSIISGISPIFCVMSTSVWATVMWLLLLSVGEAIWSPKLIEFSISIAPEGREGTYLSLSQAPLFLAKLPIGGLSGWLLQTYEPEKGDHNPRMMWFIICLTTLLPSLILILCRPFLIKEEDWHSIPSEDRQGLTKTEKADEYGSVEASL